MAFPGSHFCLYLLKIITAHKLSLIYIHLLFVLHMHISPLTLAYVQIFVSSKQAG